MYMREGGYPEYIGSYIWGKPAVHYSEQSTLLNIPHCILDSPLQTIIIAPPKELMIAPDVLSTPECTAHIIPGEKGKTKNHSYRDSLR